MNNRWRGAVAAGFFLVMAILPHAQSAPDAGPGGSKGYLQIAPNGAAVDPSSAVQFRFKADVVKEGDSIPRILERNGLHGNAATIEAFRRLNPRLITKAGKPKAGQSFSIYALESPDPNPAKISLVRPTFAKAIFSSQRETIAQTATRAEALPVAAFQNAWDRQFYISATAELMQASVQLEKASDKLNQRQLALSTFYLEQANRTVEKVAKGSPSPSGKWDKSAVAAVDLRMQPLRLTSKQVESGGVPFSVGKKVTIRVVDASGRAVNRLRVYVLPVLALQYPQDVPENTMLGLLQTLSFDQYTSPSSQMLETADLAVWVGPDYSYKKMVAMIKSGITPKSKTISSAGRTSEIAHTFLSPVEVTTP